MILLNYIKKFIIGFFWFVAFLSPLVLIHEFCHLVAGVFLGLQPESFSLGFGPVLYSHVWQGIEWKISSIPLGGYVQFPLESTLGLGSGDPKSWFVVALVGPISNLIISYGLMVIFFYKMLKKLEVVKVSDQNSYMGSFKSGKFFTERLSYSYYKIQADYQIEKLSIGEASQYQVETKKEPIDNPFLKAIYLSGQILLGRKNPKGLISLIRTATLKYEPLSDNASVMGPIGIAKTLTQAVEHSPARIVLLLSQLSWSLGIFNLLPLGILDGGKALQALFQIWFPLNPQTVLWYQLISMAIFVALFILIQGVDVWNLIKRKKP